MDVRVAERGRDETSPRWQDAWICEAGGGRIEGRRGGGDGADMGVGEGDVPESAGVTVGQAHGRYQGYAARLVGRGGGGRVGGLGGVVCELHLVHFGLEVDALGSEVCSRHWSGGTRPKCSRKDCATRGGDFGGMLKLVQLIRCAEKMEHDRFLPVL